MKLHAVLNRSVQKRIRPQTACFIVLSLLALVPSLSSAQEMQDVGNLYALVVGVSNYRHPTITQLKVSDKDARDVAQFLRTQNQLFKGVDVKLLTNEQATKAAVEENLHYWLRRAGKDDTVLLFFSGHGADDPYFPDKFYFVVHDSDPKNLQGTAVNMAGLEFLKALDSKRIVLIADTCHAGGYSMQGTKRVEPSLERFLSQFKESQGHIIITSCKPNELSMEKPGLDNSVFTHYMLEGLRGKADINGDGVVTLKESYEYVYERAKNATNGIQHPQFEGRFSGQFPISLARLHDSAPPDPGSEIENALLTFINKERTQAGLPAFEASPPLTYLARRQSENMCVARSLEHESDAFPSGWKKFTDRLKTAGLTSGAENIGYRTLREPPEKWAREVVNEWMKSAQHRKNILNPRWRYLGTGTRGCMNKIVYATLVFSSDSGQLP